MIFEPNTVQEGLLRPLIMADPVSHVYFETIAPDIKFALIFISAIAAALIPAVRSRMDKNAWRALIAIVTSFYCWTFTSGNGRYFIAGLLMAGPVVIMMISLIFKDAHKTAIAVALTLAVQCSFLMKNYEPGRMAKASWVDGNGLLVPKQENDLPAIYITINGNTYSSIIPSFNPDSRWINLVGQSNIKPGQFEFNRYVSILMSEMPINVVTPMRIEFSAIPPDATSATPSEFVKSNVEKSLSGYSLELTGDPCRIIRTQLSVLREEGPPSPNGIPEFVKTGFFICSVKKTIGDWPAYSGKSSFDAIFKMIEGRCPKQFPSNLANERSVGEFATRSYNGKYSILTISPDKKVRHEPSMGFDSYQIGSIEDVKSGRFDIDCEKFEKRYVPPWRRNE